MSMLKHDSGENSLSERKIINSPNAPGAIGPYSHSVRFGNLLFISGQLGINPAEGKMVEGGVEAQTLQAMKNLSAILESADSSLKQILKTTLFIKNMDDFPKINKIYGEFFPDEPPARSTLEVARLPLGALFEIEAVAALNEKKQ